MKITDDMLPELPDPARSYADHSDRAFSKQQMLDYARATLDTGRRTIPDSEFEFTDGVSSYTIRGDKRTIDALLRWKMNQQRITEKALSRTTPDREAIIEECASIAERTYAKDAFRFELGTEAARAIRALKTAPTSEGGA